MLKNWGPALFGLLAILPAGFAVPLRAEAKPSTATLQADKIFIDGNAKTGRAEGNVRLEQSSSTLTGTDAEYYWEAATGTIHGAMGVNPPWRFSAETMIQTSPDLFFLQDGSITSCDEVPPHYRIKSRRGKIRRGKRVTLKYPKFVPDDTPMFWLPVYTRSLVPKKYRLQIEPGQTGRDGIITKTTLSYPFTPNTWTTARWDYLQFTGNGGGLEHIYNTPTLRGAFDSYYIRDSNPDVEVPRSKRYTILWNHYQKMTDRLSANAKLDVKSDRVFGNQFTKVGNGVLVENTTRGLLSEGGFTYQFPMAALQTQFSRRDKFDSTISSKQFISHLILPNLIFNTAPLTAKRIPFYTSFSGTFINQTEIRSDPKRQLRYKKNATAGVEVKKDIKAGKKTTFTPLFAYNQSWENRVLGSTYVVTEKDQYVGRHTSGLDARRRFFKRLDLRMGYRYVVRNRLNQTRRDDLADDYGVESNQLTGSFQTRVGRNSLITLSSGYDYRNPPRSGPLKYTHSSERILSPSFDGQWEVKKNVNLFFRETYSIFDARTRTPINTPVNTSGEIQFGNPSDATMFSQGFSYSKKGFGAQSELILFNKLKVYLTPKWYVDLSLSYRAVGESKLDYRKVFPIERTIQVVRDMHCWVFRAEFSNRPGRTEASFHIDLKTNMAVERNVFRELQPSIYTTRGDGQSEAEIFPEPRLEDAPK